MPSHENHHFAPVFLLKQWETQPDEKLSCFFRINGRIVHQRYKAKSVAKEAGLYSLEGVSESERNKIERDFMGPIIDEPAADAHRAILTVGVRGLTDDQKLAWARFLVSLMVRTPDMVESLRTKGREKLLSDLNESPDEYANVRGGEPAETLVDWAYQNIPHVFDNFGITVLPQVVDSELLNTGVLRGNWASIPVSGCRHNLLIGDRPLIYVGKMSSRYVIALPVSPVRLFVAVDSMETWRRAQAESANDIIRKANLDSVSKAARYVYSTGLAQQNFIERHLRSSLSSDSASR